MDTTEQLNGTYFYGGLSNLSVGELFYWIMVDVTAEHFTGMKEVSRDIMAAAAIYTGRNNIRVSGKLANSTHGTSQASVFARRYLQQYRTPFSLLTFIINSNPYRIKIIMTQKLGTFIGRSVPVVGWIILASDAALIGWKATNRFNTIANKGDRIW